MNDAGYDYGDAVDLFPGSHGREDVPDLAPDLAVPLRAFAAGGRADGHESRSATYR